MPPHSATSAFPLSGRWSATHWCAAIKNATSEEIEQMEAGGVALNYPTVTAIIDNTAVRASAIK